MSYTYNADQVTFIRNAYRIVNSIYADALMHNMGLRSYVDKARCLARIDVDHVHNGSRYWLTSDLIDAAQSYLAEKGSACHA